MKKAYLSALAALVCAASLTTQAQPLVNPAQVSEAVTELFPAGLNGTDRGQVLRAVFLRIKASGSVG